MLAKLNLVILTVWLVSELVPLIANRLAQWEMACTRDDDER